MHLITLYFSKEANFRCENPKALISASSTAKDTAKAQCMLGASLDLTTIDHKLFALAFRRFEIP